MTLGATSTMDRCDANEFSQLLLDCSYLITVPPVYSSYLGRTMYPMRIVTFRITVFPVLVTYMQLEAYLVEIDLDAIDPLHYGFAVHTPGHLDAAYVRRPCLSATFRFQRHMPLISRTCGGSMQQVVVVTLFCRRLLKAFEFFLAIL